MIESKIEQELLEATNFKPKKNEDRDDYLRRLMLAVSKLKDPEWEVLSTEAQEWTNAGAEAHKGGDEVAEFPDFEEEVDDNPPVDEEVDEEEEPEPVKAKTKEVKTEKKVEAKPEKKAIPQSNRKVSACHTIKTMVVKKPTISVAELSEQLKESGLKVSDVTIATLRSDLRDTLRVMNELGIAQFTL